MTDTKTTVDHPPMVSLDLNLLTVENENILIRQYPTEEATEGGIVLPASAQVKKNLGWVVAISKLAQEAMPNLEVDDTVIYAVHGADFLFEMPTESQPGSIKYFIIKPQDIAASMKGQK